MRRYFSRSLVLVATLAGLSQVPAHAGLFDDDEARKALMDLRAKVDQNQKDLSNRIDRLEPGQLDLANQIESLREDVAKLRGEIELLNNSIATQDKRSKDYYTDLDSRLRKLEPQQVTVDGRSGSVDVNEQKSFDGAVAQFKSSDFKGALSSFSAFARDYPSSVYLFGSLAQLVEQRTFNPLVAGSNPARPTKAGSYSSESRSGCMPRNRRNRRSTTPSPTTSRPCRCGTTRLCGIPSRCSTQRRVFARLPRC
jgi:hypothetical protein